MDNVQESTKVVKIKKIDGKDIYVDIRGVVYIFKDVDKGVITSFKQAIKDGNDFAALKDLEKSAGKGVRVKESISTITDKILDGDDVEVAL